VTVPARLGRSPAAPPTATVARASRPQRVALLVACAAVAFLASLPFWALASVMRPLIEFFVLLTLAQMWNLLAGYAGMVSIGQQVYVGLGAYGLILFADELGLNVWLAVVVTVAVVGVLSVGLAGLAFRLRGGYFAIGTWVIAEAVRLAVSNVTQLGGGSGVTLTAVGGIDRDLRVYLVYSLSLLVGVGSVALVYALLRRRIGLALGAVRDAEVAARGLGVDVGRTKLAVYVIAAVGCSLAGTVTYLNLLRVQPDAAFSVNWTAFMIFIVVIGGIGSIEGPIIGTVVFFALQQTLADYGTWYLVLLGLVAIAVTLRARRGLWGALSDRFGWELFPVQRRLLLASDPGDPAQGSPPTPRAEQPPS